MAIEEREKLTWLIYVHVHKRCNVTGTATALNISVQYQNQLGCLKPIKKEKLMQGSMNQVRFIMHSYYKYYHIHPLE